MTVYDAKTLAVAKVFPEGSVAHPRDVVIDEANNRAYVSAALTGFVEVYDTKTLEHIGQLEFVVERGKNLFNSTDLTLDSAGGKLYGVSRDTPWVGWMISNRQEYDGESTSGAGRNRHPLAIRRPAVCMSRPRRRTMSWFLMRTVRYLRIPILVPGEYLSSGSGDLAGLSPPRVQAEP
ncbi:Uncharacterised protein [Raoultella ornithinolytica]|nr:Uncharacterised protein [Raoultella ornithinolytica]